MMFLDSYYHNNNEATSFALNRKSSHAPVIQTSTEMEKQPLSLAHNALIEKGMADCNLVSYFLKLAFSSEIVLVDLLSHAANCYHRMSNTTHSMKAINESSIARNV
jgi:hypothetical protein